MTTAINKTDATLHAYIDGQLSAHGKQKVQEFLKNNAIKRKEIETNLQVNEIIRQQFNVVSQRPLPVNIQKLLVGIGHTNEAANSAKAAFEAPQAASQTAPQKPVFVDNSDISANDINLDELDLQAISESADGKHGKWQFVFHHSPDLHSHLVLIAASITFLLGLFIGYLYPTLRGPNEAARQAMIKKLVTDAHQTYVNEKAHAVEVSAKDSTHLTNWLSSKLEMAVAPAILDKFDFELKGGRLLPSMGQNAAVYIYRKPDNSQLTLYIRNQSPLSGKKDSQCEQLNDGMGLCNWQGENLSYYMAFNETVDTIKPLVDDAVSQLQQ